MKLIDKDAVVAEIKKIYKHYDKQINSEYMSTADFMCIELKKILSFIDTLETKEVDLEKKLDSMKTIEESLGIDSDTYNKVVDECVYGEQKPTEWSEEDEKQARQIERIAHNGCTQKLQKQIADWFLSIKNRVQPKLEWGDEDEAMIDYLLQLIQNSHKEPCTKGLIAFGAEAWLKALKNKYTWRPSDEQINTLEQWLKDNQYKGDARYCYPIFDSLYQDLKKLKEQ